MQSNDIAQDMLRNIENPELREVYGSILSGKIIALVRCLSKSCKGAVIAHIDDAGKVTETPPVLDPKGKFGLYRSGLEGTRGRLDGQLGFRCYCGNSSVLCEEEKGIITPARPTQADLNKIAERLSKRKTLNPYEPKNGKTEIDGFVIEEIKV